MGTAPKSSSATSCRCLTLLGPNAFGIGESFGARDLLVELGDLIVDISIEGTHAVLRRAARDRLVPSNGPYHGGGISATVGVRFRCTALVLRVVRILISSTKIENPIAP